jgi:acyl-CoA thioester hydrolase
MATWEAEVTIEIPFHDADPMGVVWHGNYFKYFELARTALLKSFHYDYMDMRDSGYVWPVIDAHCRYAQPITYGMTIRVHATLKEYEHRLVIAYRIHDAATNKRLTKGTTTQVAVDIETNSMSLASPRILLDKLGVAS